MRADPVEVELLRRQVRTGRPCGDEEFLRDAEEVTGRRLRPRSRGRPAQAKK